MNHNNVTGVRKLITAVLIVLSSQIAFSQENTLSFNEVLKDRENTLSYRTAVLSYEKTLLEISSAMHPGDMEFSLQPGYETRFSETGEPGQTEVSLSTGLTFVLGRSAVQEERYQTALRDSQTQKLYLEQSLREAVLSLYILYSDLWLLQREEPVLLEEMKLAEAKYWGNMELFTNGAALLRDVEDSEEDFQIAEEALNQNRLKQRITWFSLEQLRGRVGSDPVEDIPLLEDVRFTAVMDETPSTLTAKVIDANPSYAQQQDTMISLSRTQERLNGLDWNIYFKPFLSYGDNDWKMTYNWENRNLDLEYTLPSAVFNSSQTSSSDNEWETGFSLILNLGSGKGNRLEADILQTEILRQKELLNAQENSLSLELRNLYLRLLVAEESLNQAVQALDRQSKLKEAVYARFEAGEVLGSDVTASEISEKREQWKVENARVDVQQTYLSLMVLLGDMSFL